MVTARNLHQPRLAAGGGDDLGTFAGGPQRQPDPGPVEDEPDQRDEHVAEVDQDVVVEQDRPDPGDLAQARESPGSAAA